MVKIQLISCWNHKICSRYLEGESPPKITRLYYEKPFSPWPHTEFLQNQEFNQSVHPHLSLVPPAPMAFPMAFPMVFTHFSLKTWSKYVEIPWSKSTTNHHHGPMVFGRLLVMHDGRRPLAGHLHRHHDLLRWQGLRQNGHLLVDGLRGLQGDGSYHGFAKNRRCKKYL